MKPSAAHGVAAIVAFIAASAPDAARADEQACVASASKGEELRDSGRLGEAKRHFQQCGEVTCPERTRDRCAEWLADVDKKMPSIVLRATDESGRDIADAMAEIDGKRSVAVDGRSVDLDPGEHTVKIARPGGGNAFEDVIIVAQSEKDRLVVAKLAAKAVEPAKRRSNVPAASVIAWSIGSLALFTFVGFAAKARTDYDDYEARCGNRCAESERDTVASSVLVADIALVVTLVAAGVGTYFYVTRPTAALPAKETVR